MASTAQPWLPQPTPNVIGRDIQQLSTAPADLRKFGVVVGLVFGGIAAWSAWRGHRLAPSLLGLSVTLVTLGLACPRILKWPYLAWMTTGLVLGWVVSTIVLTVFYYLVLTPVGLLARIAGQDFLSLRTQPGVDSYWKARKTSGQTQRRGYEHQF